MSAQHQGLRVLFYRAALPLSRQTLTFVSGLVGTHRREIGTPWRLLNAGQQALLPGARGSPMEQMLAWARTFGTVRRPGWNAPVPTARR